MEKNTPHHPLAEVQREVAARGLDCFTRSALDGVASLGLTAEQAMTVVAGLARRNFRKAMTTYSDHTVRQDVYHTATPPHRHTATPRGRAYVKFTLRKGGSIVISFKELES